jgi:hypothetical protein
MDEQVIEPEGLRSGEAFGTPTLVMRGYLSTQHLWAAEHFTRLATDYEAAHIGEPQLWIRHRSYVLGAVAESVAFLEAFINELFQDAKDATDGVVGAHAPQGLLPDAVRLMAAYWNSTEDGERVRAVAKYDAARVFAGCPRSTAGRLPHQDLNRVIALRNWSVHYRPQSFSADDPDLRIEDARARIVPENALMAGTTNLWFPDKALGAGCASWAVRTVREFVDEFVAAVGCWADYRDLSPYGEQP